jgi:RNA polymerase sigma-70 factor (ECF subfamily)
MLEKNRKIKNYKKIYSENYKYVRNILRKNINYNDLEDATQEVFFRIYKGLENFKGNSQIQTWIYKITENVSLDFKKKYVKENKQLKKINQHKVYKSYNLTKHIFDKINYEQLLYYIDSLSPKDRIILKLRELNNYDYKKISKLLSIPIGTVKSRIFYSRKKIKRMIENDNRSDIYERIDDCRKN